MSCGHVGQKIGASVFKLPNAEQVAALFVALAQTVATVIAFEIEVLVIGAGRRLFMICCAALLFAPLQGGATHPNPLCCF